MKKTLFFLFFILCSARTTQAQLQVDSLGNVNIFGKLNSYQKVIVNDSARSNLEINKTACKFNSVSNNIYLTSKTHSFHNYIINASIYDSLQENSTKKYYGVFSSVMGTRSDYSYGILGRVSWKGIGVYGTTNSTLPVITQSYAGYFSGPTHVQGNFTVSGSINGVLLGSAATPSSIQSLEESEGTRAAQTTKLQNLTAQTYYLETPQINNDEVREANANCEEGDMKVGMPELNSMEQQILTKKHYGLAVEQLEEVFPDLVYEREDGTKGINYVEMVPILIQAINELSAKVAALEGEKAEKKQKKATGLSDASESIQLLSLGQNKPNPFSTQTDIEVSVPETVQTAFLHVYDLQGKKVQQVDITARGKQTVKMDAADLAEGMYLYSLIADGKVVETRRMIVE